jgi:polyisoprenoid-binding protein YceI
MTKYLALLAAASILAIAVPRKSAPVTGSWQVDSVRSDAQLSADGTTGFGKTKTTFTLGFARIKGTVKLADGDSATSAFDFTMYPANSMAPPIDEEGKVKIEWFTNHANNTLICFHSKGTRQTTDGRLQTTGNLVLTRVDRNVQLDPNESYSGPVYGPPMIHRVTHEATFVFDSPAAAGAMFRTAGSTTVSREDFPQLSRAVIATPWPPLVWEKHCAVTGEGEAYAGSQCTGSFLAPPPFPTPPTGSLEDYPGPSGFNEVVGEHLTIVVHMRLTPSGSGATGN